MGVIKDDIERIRNETDIVALISEKTALKKRGKNYIGLCPFHSEKTPSFSVNPDLGLYHCFGCGESGDCIDFLRKTQSLSFLEALQDLASRLSFTLRFEDNKDEKSSRVQFYNLYKTASEFYHEYLLKDRSAAEARNYLKERKIPLDIISKFQIGFAPFEKGLLQKALRHFDRDLLVASGLYFEAEQHIIQESFRARIMFPIFDNKFRPIAFGARVLPSTEKKYPDLAKYKNSKETDIYQKRKTLFGFNFAREQIVAKDAVILCEGYFDCISLHIAGYKNAVATCGTSLTEDHIKMLANFTNNFIFAFDSDQAGQQAASRLWEFQDKYKLNFKRANFGKFKDPAEAYLVDPSSLESIFQQAKDLLDFIIEDLIKRRNPKEDFEKAHVAEEALAIIKKHPNQILRDSKIVMVAEMLDLSPNPLRERMKALVKKDIQNPSKLVSKEEDFNITPPELEALNIAIHRPQDIAQFLCAQFFVSEIAHSVYIALIESSTLSDAFDTLKLSNKKAFNLITSIANSRISSANALDVACRLAENYVRKYLGKRLNFDNLGISEATLREVAEKNSRIKSLAQDLKDPEKAFFALKSLITIITAKEV